MEYIPSLKSKDDIVITPDNNSSGYNLIITEAEWQLANDRYYKANWSLILQLHKKNVW